MATPLSTESPHFPLSSLSSYSLNDQNLLPPVSSSSTQNLPASTRDPTPYSFDPYHHHHHHPSMDSQPTMFSTPPYTSYLPAQSGGDVDKAAAISPSAENSPKSSNANINSTHSASGDERGPKRANKTHVPSACVNCKRAHLACDVSRPCKRCVALGRVDTCIDIKHKKRGRPKLKDKKTHPYSTHATADAKTWGQPNRHFLSQEQPPPHHHQPSYQPHQSSYHNHHHHHHHHQHHPSQHYLRSSPGFTHPSLPASTTPYQSLPSPIPDTMTMFLTLDNASCVRVTDECLVMMGYYAYELTHKSLFQYVDPNDEDKLRALIDSLLVYISGYPSGYPPIDVRRFSDVRTEALKQPARGLVFEKSDTLRLIQRNAQTDLYNVRMYLGGGLNSDPARRETLEDLYIVASFTRARGSGGLSMRAPLGFGGDGQSFPVRNGGNVGAPVTTSSSNDHLISPISSPVIDPALRDISGPSHATRHYGTSQSEFTVSPAAITGNDDRYSRQSSFYPPEPSQIRYDNYHQSSPPPHPIPTLSPITPTRSDERQSLLTMRKMSPSPTLSAIDKHPSSAFNSVRSPAELDSLTSENLEEKDYHHHRHRHHRNKSEKVGPYPSPTSIHHKNHHSRENNFSTRAKGSPSTTYGNMTSASSTHSLDEDKKIANANTSTNNDDTAQISSRSTPNAKMIADTLEENTRMSVNSLLCD